MIHLAMCSILVTETLVQFENAVFIIVMMVSLRHFHVFFLVEIGDEFLSGSFDGAGVVDDDVGCGSLLVEGKLALFAAMEVLCGPAAALGDTFPSELSSILK